MNSNTPTLYIISSWQQAEEIQKSARRWMLGSNVTKVPVEQIDDWYSAQGTIEWHDASRTSWKKHIRKHMQEKRQYSPLDDSFILMVIWNAQTLSEFDWYMWKDMRGSVVAWFVSDCVCSTAKRLSIRIHTFPHQDRQFEQLEKAVLSCVSNDTSIHWKGILDVRNAMMGLIEWTECFHPLQSYMFRLVQSVLMKKHCYNSYTLGYVLQYGLEPFSKIQDPLGLVLRTEQIVLILIKLIYTQRKQLDSKDEHTRRKKDIGRGYSFRESHSSSVSQ